MRRPSYRTQKMRHEKVRKINVKLAMETVHENRVREKAAARKKKLAWIDQVVKELHEDELRAKETAPAGGNPDEA